MELKQPRKPIVPFLESLKTYIAPENLDHAKRKPTDLQKPFSGTMFFCLFQVGYGLIDFRNTIFCHKKTTLNFDCTGWLIGVGVPIIMVYYNPYITG